MSGPMSPEIRALLARCMSQIELEWGKPDAELRAVLGVPLDASIGTKPPESSGQILLPCPFCGAELVLGCQGLEIREDEGRHTIGCAKCGVEQGFVKATREEAISAWNRRHPGDALRSGEISLNEARTARGLPPIAEEAPRDGKLMFVCPECAWISISPRVADWHREKAGHGAPVMKPLDENAYLSQADKWDEEKRAAGVWS